MFGGAHTISLQGAVFVANDPTGSLLAWKGWSAHDRQSRLGDELPLPPLPQIQPGMIFDAQDPYVAPFREVDNEIGYYLNGEWRFGQRIRVRAMHYDNRAIPTELDDGQYAWTTKFQHVGAQLLLPGNWQVLAQWMKGTTVMGPVVNGAHMVDVEFDSNYTMLTKAFENHRLSARYDHFEVSQNDQTPEDNNPEYGHVWTFAYLYDFSDKITLGAEYLAIKTHHCGWTYYGVDPTLTEKQVQISARLRFGN